MIMESEILRDLKEWLQGAEKVVVAGIGNPIRMDDFVGVKVVQDLKGKVSNRVYLIECETVPESYIQQIADFKPTHILLIDAAMLGIKPGESKLVKMEGLKMFPAFSTHTLPLRVFCEYLAKTLKADIRLLLIQPKQIDFGEGLTSEIAASAQNITKVLLAVLP